MCACVFVSGGGGVPRCHVRVCHTYVCMCVCMKIEVSNAKRGMSRYESSARMHVSYEEEDTCVI